MKIQPLHDQLLVRPRVISNTTRSGFLIPDVAKQSSPFRYGEVVAVGIGRTNAEGLTVPLQCKAGDCVAYAKGAGLEMPIETDTGEEVLVLLPEKFVLGIVTDLPMPTTITGVDGRLLAMMPTSRAMPDSAAKMREEAEIAVRAGFATDEEMGTDEPNGMTG